MKNALANWQTTLAGLVPAVPYLLQVFHLWPDALIPLPPFATVWPTFAGSIGLGVLAKDGK